MYKRQAEKEQFEKEVKEAFEAAREAQRIVKSMRNELDVSKQSFIQSLDTQKKYFMQQQEHMKAEFLKEMQNTVNTITKDQAEEIQQLKAYAGSMDDIYCKLVEQVNNQQKEITALRSELHQTQTVIEEQKQDIEYYSSELTKLSEIQSNEFRHLITKFEKIESLNSLSYGAPTNNNNELSSKLKTLEVDVNLLKQLAIR